MLRVALLNNHIGEAAASVATYFEPFTYWDWHGVSPDDGSQGTQLVWRDCKAATGAPRGCPSPREAWRRFRAEVDRDPQRKGWVERIAVASWITVEDLQW